MRSGCQGIRRRPAADGFVNAGAVEDKRSDVSFGCRYSSARAGCKLPIEVRDASSLLIRCYSGNLRNALSEANMLWSVETSRTCVRKNGLPHLPERVQSRFKLTCENLTTCEIREIRKACLSAPCRVFFLFRRLCMARGLLFES